MESNPFKSCNQKHNDDVWVWKRFCWSKCVWWQTLLIIYEYLLDEHIYIIPLLSELCIYQLLHSLTFESITFFAKDGKQNAAECI